MARATPDVSLNSAPRLYAAIEAGGTKFICALGTGPADLIATRIPTTTPGETLARVADWLRTCKTQSFSESSPLAAAGIASFGPVDLDPASPTYGHITTTPKPGWANFDFAGAVRRALNVPVAITTDVNAAILAEAEWGAARGIASSLYLTIGTGIGGGALLNGRLLQGHLHPEMGHIRLPRDPSDPFPGLCPYHADCLEGLASGPALAARWGAPAEQLPPDHPAWLLEARYLAHALANFAHTFSPRRIILGGGVMENLALFDLIRPELSRLLAGYIPAPDVLPPALAPRSGILGALFLAEQLSAKQISAEQISAPPAGIVQPSS